MNLIKVKIPTSAPFIPMVVGGYTLSGGYYERGYKSWVALLSMNFKNGFHNTPVVRKENGQWRIEFGYETIFHTLTECFENRIIPIDEIFDNGVSITYSRGYIDSHQYRPVIVTLRDYYSYLYEEIHSAHPCRTQGFSKSEIVEQWLTYSNFNNDHFNHIVKPKRNKIDFLSLNGIQSGPVRGKYITTGIIYNQDDIKITVSPCR